MEYGTFMLANPSLRLTYLILKKYALINYQTSKLKIYAYHIDRLQIIQKDHKFGFEK